MSEELRHIQILTTLITGKWTLSVLFCLNESPKRYGAILFELQTVSEKVLTETLRRIEVQKLISRTIYPSIPPKVEYRLTAQGEALIKTLGLALPWLDSYEQLLLSEQIAREFQ